MKKISKILLTCFSVGVLLCLFAGGLTFLGFIAALIIGGETATALCVFIHKTCFPWIIQICSVSEGLGLIGMYLAKRKALTFGKEEKSWSVSPGIPESGWTFCWRNLIGNRNL